MTKTETMGIMAILKEAYPMYYKGKTKEELTIAVNLWTELFVDDDAKLVKAAVMTYISNSTSGYPPVIGQIKEKLRMLTAPNELTEQEAWNCIAKATKNSAYHATEEFNKLPELVQALVGSPAQLHEWSQMETKDLQTVVASNFMRSYKVKSVNNREYQALPNDIKQLISNVSDKLSIEGGTKCKNKQD